MNQKENHEIRKHPAKLNIWISIIHFFKHFLMNIHWQMKSINFNLLVEHVQCFNSFLDSHDWKNLLFHHIFGNVIWLTHDFDKGDQILFLNDWVFNELILEIFEHFVKFIFCKGHKEKHKLWFLLALFLLSWQCGSLKLLNSCFLLCFF